MCVLAAVSCSVTHAQAQAVKSAVYIDLEDYSATPTPTYSGLNCSGNCNNLAGQICTAIGYKYGTSVRMINNQLGGIVCFDTIGLSFSIENGQFIKNGAQKK
jgi:hypothetical protein